MTSLKAQAIQTALQGNWKSAISLNEQLLKTNPDDIETLNRLAFAFTALRKAKDAKQTYHKVLKLDSQNPIALKNLKRLNGMDKKGGSLVSILRSDQLDTMFIEEGGKTKILDLVNLAQSNVITRLMTGEALSLRIKRLKIFVLNNKNQYIGMMPDDIGKRLIKLLKAGNLYEVYIKGADKHHVAIFVRETKRCTRYKNLPSFITTEKVKIVPFSKSYRAIPDAEEFEAEPEDET